MKFQLLIKNKMLKRKIFHAFKLLDLVFIILINVKMTTNFGILTFTSMINSILSRVEHEKIFYNLQARSVVLLYLTVAKLCPLPASYR